VAFSNDGSYTIALYEGFLVLFNNESKKKFNLDSKLCRLCCVSVHPQDQCIATGSSNGKIIIWYNAFSKKNVTKVDLNWHHVAPDDLTFSPDGIIYFEVCVFFYVSFYKNLKNIV